MSRIETLKQCKKSQIWKITSKYLKWARMQNLTNRKRYDLMAYTIVSFYREEEANINAIVKYNDAIKKLSDYESELKAFLEKVKKEIQ